jgi:site-specific DNA recombinase
VLQSLVRDAAVKPQPFEFIVFLNFSRYFRNLMESELYRAKFEQLNISLVSVQQDFADDSTGRLVRQVIGAIDEFALNFNAQQVSLMMLSDARAGCWNGSSPPLGYQTRVAVQMGNKDKKVLAINGTEAPVVEHIFRLYLQGENGGRPMGLKAICTHLNREG